MTFLFSCQSAQTPSSSSTGSAASKQTDEILAKIEGLDKYSGYFNFYWDAKTGKVYLEIDKLDVEFLYVNSLAAGIGSNDIGLDRGQLGNTRVVKFVRTGNKVLLTEPNYGYRAISDNPDESRSVAEAFAQSVIWGFTVEASNTWSVLVDATDFLLRDAHNVAQRLTARKQGTYKLDKSRSAIYLPMCKNFPKNTELEATITFTGEPKGQLIRSVTPSADAVTVRMHHSLIELPDDNFALREFDPRSAFYAVAYHDYATPIDEPLVKRYIRRHRLVKKNPEEEMSEPVEPIIYYLDRGAPEPIRSALLEGGAWWNEAFEAAGFKNAFQVKMLPEDADPLDVRYNMIQWIHRSTRGWSYGLSVVDPRTGEIIKGHVSLGSLRVRQDYLIAEGLLSPYEDGKEVSGEMMKMSVARLRQLSAHEIGHTLGLVHSYASNRTDRASVMDYPHPLVKLDPSGNIDLSDAYDDKIGAWDKISIRYGYSQFPEGTNEKEELDKILQEAFDQGILHLTDQDGRPAGSAHPYTHLWDNGASPAAELNRMMGIRKKIIADFSDKTIKKGAPMATIEEALVPMYLFHRYQVEATSKVVGGLNYTYALKGDGQMVTELLDTNMQMEALDALINTMSPESLALPESLISNIPPRPFGYPRTRETFKSRTGLTFDPLTAAEVAASIPPMFLFHPERASRLVEYKARDPKQPGLEIVIERVLQATWKAPLKQGYEKELQRIAAHQVLYYLMKLASNNSAREQARAITHAKLIELKSFTEAKAKQGSADDKAYYLWAALQIENYLKNPDKAEAIKAMESPDGPPIGTDLMDWFRYCSME